MRHEVKQREETEGVQSPPPVVAASLLWILAMTAISHSEIYAQAPITSSGLNTQVKVSPGNPAQYDITGGTRAGGGPNLFHSFGHFNVPDNTTANFLNETAAPTANILGRVTGGNPSNILGTVQTTGFGTANLFLMNPAGIVFGPNASLNVGGSATFTTADYLRLADGAQFTAVPGPQDASLSSAPVAAFGFLGSNPAAITIQDGQLVVADGRGLSLIGGDIALSGGKVEGEAIPPGGIQAPGGDVYLASAASAGEVTIDSLRGEVAGPTANGHDISTWGHISFSEGASVNTSADGAGRVVIRGGEFTMDDASIKAMSVNGSGGSSDGPPTISITAERVSLANGAHITADSHGTAAAGDIAIHVDTLTTQAGDNRIQLNPDGPNLANGNLIGSDSRNQSPNGGPSGVVRLEGINGPGTAASRIMLRDTTVTSRVFGGTSETRPSEIIITADELVLTNEGLRAGGRAATIVANTIGEAPAGDISLNVHRLLGNVDASETPIPGAKTVFIVTSNNAGDSAGRTGTISISGPAPERTDPASLVAFNNVFISSGADGGTAATAPGNILITAETVSLTNDTGIVTATFGDAMTPAGNIALNVKTLRSSMLPDGTFIEGQPQVFIVSSSGAGQAGTLTVSGLAPEATDVAERLALNKIELNTVTAGGTPDTPPATITLVADAIHLTNSKHIKTDTSGAAPAGDLSIRAREFIADLNSRISSSSSGDGQGGTISILAGESATIAGSTSIAAQSTGMGDAGNIEINAGARFLGRDASITTQASHASGGNITVQATDSIHLVNSQINTSVQGGPTTAGGNIMLDPAVVALQNSQVLAQAVQGQGGNITIIAGTFLADQTSVVSASSQFGLSGQVNIQSPISNLSGSLATLPHHPLQGQPLLRMRCASAGGGQVSTFVVAGRDILPAEPDGWLLSPLAATVREIVADGVALSDEGDAPSSRLGLPPHGAFGARGPGAAACGRLRGSL